MELKERQDRGRHDEEFLRRRPSTAQTATYLRNTTLETDCYEFETRWHTFFFFSVHLPLDSRLRFSSENVRRWLLDENWEKKKKRM